MSKSAQWQRDQNGNAYYWEPQPPQGAQHTPRVAAQATRSGSTVPASDRDVSPQYTTRQPRPSFSYGDSNDASARLQAASSQQQASIGQTSAVQATWQANLVTSPPLQGYGRSPTGTTPIIGASGAYGQTGLLSALPGTGQGVAVGQVGYTSSTRSTSTSQSVASAAYSASPQGTVRRIHREIESTPGEFEELDPRYKRRKHDFFQRFRVFKMHWAQPADRSDGTNVTDMREPLPREFEKYLPKDVLRDKRFGQYIFTKIRWFVVVKEGADKCLCVPIVTYQGRGVGKDVIKDEHAIVYTTREAPTPDPDEQPQRGERPMRTAIRVQTDEKGDKLAEKSRIDYGRVYTVEHNIKAMAFGWVHEQSRKDFQFDFLNVFMGDEGYADWSRGERRAHHRNKEEDSDDASEGDSDDSDDEDDDDENAHNIVKHRQPNPEQTSPSTAARASAASARARGKAPRK